MIRKKKRFLRPRKLYESVRIAEENKLLEKYALKNKREVWKMIAKLKYFRDRAKALAKSSREEQEILFGKLNSIGLSVQSIADVLDLKVENLLERRLSTIVAKKGLASTPQHARQLIVHKKVLIDGKVLNAPSYFVKVAEENLLSVKNKVRQPKVEEQKPAEQKEDAESEEVKEEKVE